VLLRAGARARTNNAVQADFGFVAERFGLEQSAFILTHW